MSPRRFVVAAVAAGLLGSCTAGPEYRPPGPPEMASFSAGGGISSRAGAEVTGWWRQFGDPVLDDLVERAAAGNHDLRIAASRVLEARANRGAALSDRLPAVRAGASAVTLRLSETGLETANLPTGGGPFSIDFDPTQDLYEAGFDASWEIDLFGRVTRSIEAAEAELASTEADLADVMVTLLSEVARNYVALREVQARIGLTRRSLELQRETLSLTEKRFERGLSTRLDVTRAAALAAETEARIPQYRARAKVLRHRLAILLGETPDVLCDELEPRGGIPAAPEGIVVGVPADLLRRRPDIRAAERDLAAQVARIGVAEADLYPRLRLIGSIGLSTVDLDGARLDDSWTGSLGPAVSWSLFEGGAIRARIAAADARARAALARYEKTVLLSYEEVENALAEHGEELRRRESLRRAVASDARAHELALRLYDAGLADAFEVLDTLRRLLAAEEQLAESDAIVSTRLIGLYKAFGGGISAENVTDGVKGP